jgi:hypothetical protein
MPPAALPEGRKAPSATVICYPPWCVGLGNWGHDFLRVCVLWYPGGCVVPVWTVDEMNHTKLRRVIWREFGELIAIDDKIDDVMVGCR